MLVHMVKFVTQDSTEPIDRMRRNIQIVSVCVCVFFKTKYRLTRPFASGSSSNKQSSSLYFILLPILPILCLFFLFINIFLSCLLEQLFLWMNRQLFCVPSVGLCAATSFVTSVVSFSSWSNHTQANGAATVCSFSILLITLLLSFFLVLAIDLLF